MLPIEGDYFRKRQTSILASYLFSALHRIRRDDHYQFHLSSSTDRSRMCLAQHSTKQGEIANLVLSKVKQIHLPTRAVVLKLLFFFLLSQTCPGLVHVLTLSQSQPPVSPCLWSRLGRHQSAFSFLF